MNLISQCVCADANGNEAYAILDECKTELDPRCKDSRRKKVRSSAAVVRSPSCHIAKIGHAERDQVV
jgi:hypothetical protein